MKRSSLSRYSGQSDYEDDKAAPSSSSPPPVREDGFQYDVFLSFRGPDTRNGFTGHLYQALQNKGIRTFIDSEKLEKGQKVKELFMYIETSKIYVPIFSKGYADSEWCLKEISKMVECKRLIIPVFFDVEPRDVRGQSGPFEPAFTRYGKNDITNKEEVRKWRNALTEAGEVSGYNLANTDGSEARLIKHMVNMISSKVNNTSIFVSTHPVGLASRVAQLVEMLKVEAQNDVKVVGIHGMGGIGKTTLARAVYNQICPHFDASSFISDVGEEAKQSKLVSLQERLLEDVLKDTKVKVNDIAHGIGMIMKKIKHKKVLLVLDNIDCKKQLDALAGSVDWFHSGSRIIITTRNKEVLIGPLRVENVYELKVLDDVQALQLFSWHAFGKEEPPTEFAKLSREVADTAAGLPLALEIFGRHFFSLRTNKLREDMLKKLKKYQHKDIHEMLKISFDALEKEEKIIFLDIACFFIGQQKSFATFIWKERGFFLDLTIEVLMHKCLVNINEHTGAFEMHDHIRDMGRKIVEDESPNPENRSRLWQKDDILNVMQKEKGTEKIEAINLSCEQHSTQHVNAKSFAGMSQLKMLQLWNVRFEGQYRGFPRTLRWLRWNSQDLHCLPDELSLEDIVVLDLSCSYNMHQVWHQERSGSTKVFSQLKVLNLKACRSLAICPNFTGMPHIEELHFEGCVSLTELHPSIWQLTSLEVLHLRYCFQITALPSQPSDSKSLKPPLLGRLKVLNFSSCKRLTICPDFKGMPHIEELSLEDCDALTELHPSIWRLTSLEVLDLRGCSQITALPSQPSDSKSLKQTLLERLKVLNLPYCSKLTTCPNFLLMPHLEKLDFEACGNMTELHPSIGRLQSLTHLNLRGCGSLNELPKDAWQLTSLENLDLGYSCKIATLPSELGNLERLRELFLDGTIITALPESMRHLKQLKHLSLNECRFLKEIPEGIHSCISLEQLEARNCESLASFPNVLGDLRSLRYLNLSGTAIEELPSSIHSLTQFYQLSIIGCKRLKFCPQLPHSRKRVYAADCCEMEEIADVSKAIELQELDLTGCQKLVDVPGVEHLRGLMLLKLGGCGSLKELPKDAWQLTSLENLDLRYCRKIATLPSELGNLERLKQLFLDGTIITALPESMRHLKQLNHLSLNECYLLKELPSSIHSLTQLTELSIIRCKRLKFLPQLPRSIQRVHAADCCEMEEIADVSKAIDLWELDLTSCQKLVVVPGVEQLRHLSKLKLEGCRSLKELPEEAWHLTSLENLDLCYCCKVATLPSQLGNSERLEQLFLDGTIITALPESMRHVKQLKHLSLNECRFLKEIPEGIHSCISLEKLEARNCESLASFPNVLGDLRSLRYLNLSGTAIEELPSSIHSLTQFYQLSIIGCKRLKFLPQLPRSIRSVYANGCCEMEQIADVSKAVDLRELDLSVCQKLVDVPGVEHLRGLKLLKLRGCGSLKELPEEAWQLTSLENLDLRYCCKIATLPSELGNSKRLEQLFLDGTFIKALPESIRHLKQLKCLYLNECHFLKEIPEGIRSCISLEVLETGNCKKLASFPNVLGDLRSLRSLNFSRTAIEELPSSIHSLLKFRELSIIRCERLKFLPQLPSSIRIVYAAYCCELEEIADVSKAIDLSELDLTGCQKLVDVPGVEQLRCLQKLKLGGCRSLSDSFKKRVQEAHFPNLVEKLTIPGSMEES